MPLHSISIANNKKPDQSEPSVAGRMSQSQGWRPCSHSPFRDFKCCTAILKTVSLSSFRAMGLHWGIIADSSSIRLFILSLLRFSVWLWASLRRKRTSLTFHIQQPHADPEAWARTCVEAASAHCSSHPWPCRCCSGKRKELLGTGSAHEIQGSQLSHYPSSFLTYLISWRLRKPRHLSESQDGWYSCFPPVLKEDG